MNHLPVRQMLLIIFFLSSTAPSLVLAADIKNGAHVYSSNCSICHADDGRGSVPNAPNFRFQGGLVKPDTQLFDAISSGKGMMPAFRGILTEKDILDVISYLRTL